MKCTPFCLALLCLLLGSSPLFSQTIIDLGIGTSQQDQWASQIALRQQLNPKFRAGLELQFSTPRYRFIEAKPITEGYSLILSLPLTYQLYEQDQLQLFGLFKPGFRRQGIIDPDGNDQRDSILNSTALLGELGLLINIIANERLNIQSGVSFPAAFEINPTNLFENLTTLLHAGLTYRSGERSVLFAKANMGAAFGASGDSHKFLWSTQIGLRFALGKKLDSLFVESAF